MTFEPHPREFFAPQAAPMRISNLRDKLGALREAGIDRVFIQHFNRRFAQLSATEFVERILLDGCDVRWLLVGDDFRFGARRAGDNALLQRYSAQGRFELEQMPTFDDGGERISSTGSAHRAGRRRPRRAPNGCSGVPTPSAAACCTAASSAARWASRR